MTRTLPSLIGLVLLAGVAHADATPPSDLGKPEKVKDIRRLLEVSGAGKMGIQVLTAMVGQFKTMMPKVPPKFWDDFAKEAKPEELIDLVVPLYDKRLTHEEVKGIIKFYESPVGRKLVGIQPELTAESMEVGKQWGMKLGMRVQKQLQEKGYGK
jgi:hypothetical protein